MGPTSPDMHRQEIQRRAAEDDPRGLGDGMGAPAASRREIPRDVRYSGRGFPKLADVNYLRPVELDGAFHVERWLADRIGEFGAVLVDSEGREWAVFEIDAIEWID